MKNQANDLNNHLFAQLERLGDESLKGEELDIELKRSEAISNVAGKIIDLAKTEVLLAKVIDSDKLPVLMQTSTIQLPSKS